MIQHHIEGVLLCLLFILFTFKILDRVDMILHKHAKVFDVYLEFDNNKCVAQFREELMMQNLKLTMFEVSPDKARGKGLTALATIEVKERSKRVLLMDILRKMDCLKFVEEI